MLTLQCPSLLTSSPVFYLLHPVLPPHIILMVSFLAPFFRFLFTNQAHTHQHQELMQGINDTYACSMCFYLIFYYYLTNVY